MFRFHSLIKYSSWISPAGKSSFLKSVSSTGKLKGPSCFSIKLRGIQTTSPKHALPPMLVLLLKPLLRVSGILIGRILRQSWNKLSPETKRKILAAIKARQTHIAATFTVISGAGYVYYLEHIEEDPLTKRKRFIFFTNEQMMSIADMAFQQEVDQHQKEIIPVTHPIYRMVSRVANRLLQANNDLSQVKDKKWTITIIDRPEIVNAFVLPNGQIVLFSGILNLASNEDQLAIVMSHEISHALLDHTKELLSYSFVTEVVLLVPIVIIWTLLPALAALFSDRLTASLANVIVSLPYSRALEMEADVVGLKLAAKACYDVREAPTFWGKMAQVTGMDAEIDWLSTHPSSTTRQAELWKLLPEALHLRDLCQCPRLPAFRTVVQPSKNAYPLSLQTPVVARYLK